MLRETGEHMTTSTRKMKHHMKQNGTEPEDELTEAQGRLEYLRGPSGERDRLTIWKAGRGLLPGTGAGGMKEGWLDSDN
jgi:hypothetical protein